MSEEMNTDIRLSRKQKKAIKKAAKIAEKEERKRAQKELSDGGYHTIQSTQIAIPIRDVYRGIIITRDNRFLKVLEFSAQNLLMFSNEMRNNVDASFEAALRVFPETVQFKVFSRKADVDSMIRSMVEYRKIETSPECIKLDDEYIAHLHDTAMREGVTRIFLAVIEHNPESTINNEDFEHIRSSLQSTAARVRTYMEQCGNNYIPSCDTDAGIISLLYQILNRKAADTKPFSNRVAKVTHHYIENRVEGDTNFLSIPAPEFFSPAWIDYRHPRYLVIDGKFYTFGYLTSNGYVSTVACGWLNAFINSWEGVDVDIYMNRIPKDKVREAIAHRISWNRAKASDTSDVANGAETIINIIRSGKYLLDGLSSDQDFYYNSVLITVSADSLKMLNMRYTELDKMARSMGLRMQRCNYQMEDAFISSLPICNLDKNIYKKSRRNMLTSGTASLYPFVSYELQDKGGIMIGVNSTNNSLVSVNIFDTSAHVNANMAIMGMSGYGKTFTALCFALRMRLQHKQVFILTPKKGDNDYLRTVHAVNGQYISMGPGSQYYINVMDIRIPDSESQKEIGGDILSHSALAQKVQSLHVFFSLLVRELQQEEEQLLDGYMFSVYEDYGITDDNASLFVPGTKDYKKMPILSDLYEKIKEVPELKRIANILYPMIRGSMAWFNHRTNVDLSNKFIVFDQDGLEGRILALSMHVALDFIWSKTKENRLESKAIFIDEAWNIISSEKNEMAADNVREIFKTIRSYGGAAFIMTQEVSEFFSLKGGTYGNAILNNCDSKLFLHLSKREVDCLTDTVDITPQETDRIQKLKRGSGLLITGNNKLFIDIQASSYETDIITTDPNKLRKDRDDNRGRKAIEDKNNESA